MSMDLEDRKKRQTLKVLLIEAIMSVAVVITVVILVLVVSGYSIGDGYKLEQGGLLRVDSEPTGASVLLDGEKLGDTNFSRVVSSTEHEVVLEKEGYDSWKKNVTVSKGLLYHLRYPRLFLKDRAREHVLDFNGIEFASVSPDHNGMFLIENDFEWSYLELRNEKLTKKQVKMPFVFADGTFEVKQAFWSRNGRRIVLDSLINEKRAWLYVDLDNEKNCFDLSQEFGVDFEKITILDGSANELLVYNGKKLQKIDVSKRLLSADLADNVEDYYTFVNNIVFISNNEIKMLRGADTVLLMPLTTQARIAAVNFYDNKYLIVYTNNSLTVYEGDELKKVLERDATINLSNLKIMDGEGYVVARDGNTINALDMEAMELSTWSAEADDLGWLDRYLIYSITNSKLTAFDFDGQNGRQLSENVSAGYPVTITDNKWLYYFSDGALMRELIKK